MIERLLYTAAVWAAAAAIVLSLRPTLPGSMLLVLALVIGATAKGLTNLIWG
jgi:hypothetical protein